MIISFRLHGLLLISDASTNQLTNQASVFCHQCTDGFINELLKL